MSQPTPASFAAVATLLVAASLAGCAGPGAADGRFSHIHGMAVHPEDPSVLYVATHHGLYQGVGDAAWSKVSQVSWDFMGFSAHPTDPHILWASGHPERPSVSYWALGVVQSTDGGITWDTIALRNEVDFHAMTVSLAEPDTLWGHYRDQVYVSADGGLRWDPLVPQGLPARVFSLASSAADADTVYAATEAGVLVSRDGGAMWDGLGDGTPTQPALLLATTRADAELLWAVFAGLGPARSQDGGATWTAVAPITWADRDAPAGLAIDPSDAATVYVGTARGGIYKTTDAGASWVQVKEVE